MEAEAGGKECDGGRGGERGDEAAFRGSGCPSRGGRDRESAGVRADGRRGCGNGKGGPGPWSRFPFHRSGCAGRGRPGTPQGETTGDWEEAPRRHS